MPLKGHIMENGNYVNVIKPKLEKIKSDQIAMNIMGIQNGRTYKPGEYLTSNLDDPLDYGEGVTVAQSEEFKLK